MVEVADGEVASPRDGGPSVEIPLRRGIGAFLRTGYCSQALFRTLNRAFDDPLDPEERATVPLAGGIMGHGHQCGMVWGAALGAGAEAYRRLGSGARAQAKAIVGAQRVLQSFFSLNQTIECSQITKFEWGRESALQTAGFLLTGGPVRCFRMAGRYPSEAFGEIEAVLSDDHDEALPAPVGCAALVAHKMGASDARTVTAAGLAGGIGLSGSGCGALGAAIWLLGLETLKKGAKKISYKPEKAQEMVERFVCCTGGEFDCAAITGRRFDGVADHAAFIRDGGCAEIIETLTACGCGHAEAVRPPARGGGS